MHRTKTTLSALLTTVTLATSAHGQLFSDNLESYSNNSALPTTSSSPWEAATATRILVRNDATATPFGSSNKYCDFNDDASTGSNILRSKSFPGASGTVTTFSFDFFEPSNTGNSSVAVGYSQEGQELLSATRRVAVNLNNGTIGGLSTTASNTYSLDTPNRFFFIFNDTSAPATYPGGTIAAESAHIWVQPFGGTLTFAGTRLVDKAQTASYQVGFRTFSSSLQQILLDNLKLESGAALPAPEIETLSPADNSSNNTLDADLVATFSQSITAGTGNIVIENLTDSTTVATIPVTDPQVTISANTLTINPTADLLFDKRYAIQIDTGVVKNSLDVDFAGIADGNISTWNFSTENTASGARSSFDLIVGRRQTNGTTLGYKVDSNSGQVGLGGGTNAKSDRITVIGLTLPTLPVGTTVKAADLKFEISQARNTSGGSPELDVYLLDVTNPDTSEISLFYQGPSDPNTDAKFVGSTLLTFPNSNQVTYTANKQDQYYTITGDALTTIQDYYGGDNVPDRSEVFFRFNLDELYEGSGDGNLDGIPFSRYFLDSGAAESSLEVTYASAAATPYDVWAAANSNPGGPTENGDTDPLNNLLEFAFGTNPIVNDNIPLSWAGTGNDVVPGSPATSTSFPIEGGVDFTARFLRRKDHGSAGSVSYTWRFSSDLMDWESSADTPTWFVAPVDLADDASGDYDLVEVPYPLFLASGKKARFFQVVVTTP